MSGAGEGPVIEPGFERKDYYRVLQVHRSAHPEVVRAAFRTLVKVLCKHPDLGGQDGDARVIIEAYTTLSDPEQRRAYDLWLQAHSRPAGPRSMLAPGVANWIRMVLPEYRDAPEAPFAGRFDLVLASETPLGAYLYVKGFGVLRRLHWPMVLTLGRAVRLVRTGILPSSDTLLVVATRATGLDLFLAQIAKQEGGRRWNRCAVAVCTLSPLDLRTAPDARVPWVIRRLRWRLDRIELDWRLR
jgi:hypothetical protein